MKTTAILPSRNDNYGDNLSHRASMSLSSMIESHDEVVFVEWKIKNNDSLFSSIKNKLPHQGKLKYVPVSSCFLKEHYSDIYQYTIIESIARNIAIRRASNDYIISTNIDILVNDLNKNILSENTFFTVPRRDIPQDVHLQFDDYQDLHKHINRDKDSFRPKERINSKDDIWSLINCCGDYQIGHRNVWYKMKGFEESILFGCGIDTNVMKKASFFSQIKVLDHYIFHLNHGKNSQIDNDEIQPPISNQNSIIRDFIESSNPDTWGMSDKDLPIEIL